MIKITSFPYTIPKNGVIKYYAAVASSGNGSTEMYVNGIHMAHIGAVSATACSDLIIVNKGDILTNYKYGNVYQFLVYFIPFK